jgi:hypothetical protein
MKKRWTEREIQMLEQLSMNLPTDCIHKEYNAWAARNQMPPRTRKAIMLRSRICQIVEERACGEWVKISYISSLLKIDKGSIIYWLTRYNVPCHRDSRNQMYFKRSSLAKAAKAHPIIFKGAKSDDLFMLLEDRDLADSIALCTDRKGNDPKPVRSIETGKIYESVSKAAASVYVSRSGILYGIKTGAPVAGYHWAFL